MIELTGDPPSFKCPKCGKTIYCQKTKYAMEIKSPCSHAFEIHQQGKVLTAVFKY